MEFALNEDQAVLLVAIDGMIAAQPSLPTDAGSYVRYSASLQEELAAGGFTQIGRTEGFGPLEAALMVERVARCPWSVEIGASALVAPMLGEEVAAPLALCEGVGRPTRFLAEARHVCLLEGNALWHGPLDPDAAKQIDTVLSYPVGVLAERPPGLVEIDASRVPAVLTAWQVAVAAEGAGLMRGALDATVAYVKERRQFGQPLAAFQAVQHRLAICEQIVSASYWLAMRAAAAMTARDAATALTYIQQNARTVVYDCHQFTGAMGVTLEYPLHLWTYRLKFLQGELGGRARHAAQLSQECWPDTHAA